MKDQTQENLIQALTPPVNGASTPGASPAPGEKEAPPAAKAVPSFLPEPFRPVSIGQPLTFSLGVGLMFVAAVAVGGLASVLGHFRYVAVLFPLGMASLLAGIGCGVLWLGRFRGRWVLLLVGLAAGLAANVSMHFFNYQGFMGGQGAALSFDPGVAGYLDLIARHGIPMRPFPLGPIPESPTEGLSYEAGWWFLRLELLLTGAASALLLSLAGSRFAGVICPGCKDWKRRHDLGLFLYSVSPFTIARVGETVATALTQGNLACLWLAEGDLKRKLESYFWEAHACPRCRGAWIDLHVRKARPEEHVFHPGRSLLWVSYPPEALPYLDLLCRRSRGEDEK